MEFKGDFLRSLKSELGITPMFSYTSIYPKASIIGKDIRACKTENQHCLYKNFFPYDSERCIRSIKRYFFECLYTFRTSDYEFLIKLVQNAYNNRGHTSLTGYRYRFHKVVF